MGRTVPETCGRIILRAALYPASWAGAAWLHARRRRYRPAARPLAPIERAALAPYFDAPLLDACRIAEPGRIEDPRLYRAARALRLANPRGFAQTSGLAVIDTVAVAGSADGPPPLRLLFHELVHLAQYRRLGTAAFLRAYLRGWVEGGFDYHAIPLEADAYALDARFTADGPPFDAVAEVDARLALR